MQQVLMAIDVGTTRTKVCLFNLEGRTLAAADEIASLQRTDAAIEGDPSLLLQQVIALGSRCLEMLRNEKQSNHVHLLSVGVTGQMGSWIGIDEQWRAVTPLDSYLDTRFLPIKAAMMQERGEAILTKTGITPFIAPKLLWWMQYESERFSRVAKVVAPSGFIAGALASLRAEEAFVDRTQVWIWGLTRTELAQWDNGLISSLGIPPAVLPAIVEPWQNLGGLSPVIAARWRVDAGIPVAAGIGDGMAGWLGCGAIRPGIAVDTAGTTDHLAFTISSFQPDRTGVISATPSALPDIWHHQGWSAGIGGVHAWLHSGLGLTEEEEQRAALLAPGAKGHVLVPHFSGRVCPDQPDLRGAILGLEWGSERSHFYRAFLEAVSYEYFNYARASRRLGGEPVEEVRVIGSGGRNRLWNEIKANLLNAPYHVLSGRDYTAWGTALVGAVAAGVVSIDQLPLLTEPEIQETIWPQERASQQYRELAEVYLELLLQLEPLIKSYRSKVPGL